MDAFLNAERTPFRGPLNPGLEVTSSGRGCNTISGEFYIYELDLTSQDPSFALDFIQFCDSTTASLRGSIRINSNAPIPFDQPFAVASVNQSNALEGSAVTLDASNSISMTSDIQQTEWSHVSGPVIEFPDPFLSVVSVTLPIDIELGGETTTLRLTVTDAFGQQDSREIDINIASKSDPKTFFSMSSEAGDFIGQGRDWFYDLSSATITANSTFDNGVSISISGSEFWSAEFAAPDSEPLEVGEYNDAERWPFQSAGAPGLSVSGDGRGCNRNFGSFNVDTIERDNNGDVFAFAATFHQTCESRTAPLLMGTVAVNAKDENVPTASAGEDIEVLEGGVVNLNGSASSDDIGQIVSFAWSSDDFAINSSNDSRANFVAPLLGDRVEQQIFTVSLLITDNEGFKDIDVVNVVVNQNNAAPVSNDDQVSLFVGQTVSVSVLQNDSDVDGQLRQDTIDIATQPANGNVIVNANGTVSYTHTGSEPVADTFQYTVLDNDGAVSNVSVVNLQVAAAPVQEPPVSDDVDSSGGAMGYYLIALLLFITQRRKMTSIAF